jgi:hypothetical protein
VRCDETPFGNVKQLGALEPELRLPVGKRIAEAAANAAGVL